MLPNTNPVLTDLIASAKHPVVVLVFSDGCENEPTKEQKDVEEIIRNSPLQVFYYTWCISESMMPMPRIATALYFFLPGNQTPAFWRLIIKNGNVVANLNKDLEILDRMFTEKISYEQARYTPEEFEKLIEVENFLEREKETLHTFPSSFQMARNLAKEIWKTGKAAAAGLPILVSTEVGYSRLSICESCEKLDKSSYRCSECGCYMKTKTQLAASSCPLKKWEEIV